HDFLKEYPEHREKKTKRKSSEGKKAFESAYKAYIKKYLAEQSDKYDKQSAKAAERSKALNTKVSGLRKAKKFAKATLAQKKAGQADRAIAQLTKQKEHVQAAHKSL
ncbi:MAG: hypothetical protein ABH871_02325, partial [Pseudomonadota bacterium]